MSRGKYAAIPARVPGKERVNKDANVGHYDLIKRFVLSCRHEIRFRNPWPEIGDSVYCFRCRQEAKITDFQVYWTCHKCHSTQFNGLAKVQNEVKAAQHYSRYNHTIHLYDRTGKLYLKFERRDDAGLFSA